MKEQELNNLLDKAIGTKGNLQIHSYWMNKTLKGIIEYNKEVVEEATEELLADNKNIAETLGTYEFIDLGLPSGLKWASCNVGASKPEEYGLYFAWGETKGYKEATELKKFIEEDYKFGTSNALTKYNYDDDLTVLELEDDAAYKWYDKCRMPTKEDLEELLNNTNITRTSINGISGLKFTSFTNNNSIFIPAAGLYYLVFGNNSINESVMLWTSSRRSDRTSAWHLECNYNTSYEVHTNFSRESGLSVRAVQEANINNTFNSKNCVERIYALENTGVPTHVSLLCNDANYISDDGALNGVYAVTEDGLLIDYHSADESCIGVALITDNLKIMIAKDEYSNIYWGYNLYNKDVATIPNKEDFDVAIKDFDGKLHTAAIIESYSEYGVPMHDNDMCKILENYNKGTFNDWYIPSLGLLREINYNMFEIRAALIKIGSPVMENRYLSSLERDAALAWYVDTVGSAFYINKTQALDYIKVRFVRDISTKPSMKDRILSLEERILELESKTLELENQLSDVYTKSEVDAKILELQTLINNYINGTSQGSELDV